MPCYLVKANTDTNHTVITDDWLQFKGLRLAETMVALGLLMIDLIIKILSYTVRPCLRIFTAGLVLLAKMSRLLKFFIRNK